MLDIDVIQEPGVAIAALDPIRSRLLAELAEPASAAALAPRVGLARQKVRYHLKTLESHGLITETGNRRWVDLIGFGQDGVYVALSNGTSFGAISKWTSAFDLSHGWTVKDYVRTVGDVNNDGRVDLIGFGQDGVYIALSMGTTFSLPSRRTTSFDLSHGWTVASYVRVAGEIVSLVVSFSLGRSWGSILDFWADRLLVIAEARRMVIAIRKFFMFILLNF